MKNKLIIFISLFFLPDLLPAQDSIVSRLVWVQHADLNNDGFEDIITTNQVETYRKKGKKREFILSSNRYLQRIFYGHSDGLSSTPDSIVNLDNSDGIILGRRLQNKIDLNKDNIVDSVAQNGKELRIFYGSSTGYSKEPNSIYKFEVPERKNWSCFFYDYNGDGFPDIMLQSNGYFPSLSVVSKVNHKTQVITGSATGFSIEARTIPELENKEVNIIKNNDFNGDHKEDLFLSYPFKVGIQAELWLGANNSEPLKKQWKKFELTIFGGDNVKFYETGDVDGDGKKDIGILKWASGKEIRKNGSFPLSLMIYPGCNDEPYPATYIGEKFQTNFRYDYANLVHGDFDGDGFDDVFALGLGPKVLVVWGAEKELLVEKIDIGSIPGFSKDNSFFSVAMSGDFNGDKRTDLIIFSSQRLWVVYGNGMRTISPVEIYLPK